MKLRTMMAMVLAAGIGTSAQGAASPPRVVVYLRDNASVQLDVKTKAEVIAARMFSEIGVQIEWHTGAPRCTKLGEVLAINPTRDTPTDVLPGAMAYALPYEGVHIRVFYDRVEATPAPAEVLAHVLVHEITHILQGTSRHSDSGVMKALWSRDDFNQMRFRTLPFTEEDVRLIRLGLGARNLRAAVLEAVSSTPEGVPTSRR